MRALDRKLVRDLRHLRGQVATIALVVASGVGAYVALEGTYASLEYGRRTYYERQRFADVFAHLERAPDSLGERIEAIDGVAVAHTRLVEAVTVPIETLDEPAIGQIVSVPAGGRIPLNDVVVRAGRMVEPGRSDEVVVLETFAQAHGLLPGAELPVVVNGRLRDLRIVGLGMSPEYVYPPPVGGIFSDETRFAALWMDRDVVEAAFRMEGTFDDVVLRLQPGASVAAVKDALDRVLEPYGGRGAVGRDRQISNYIVEGEMSQLRSFGGVAAAIFLGVAAFLVNVVLSRLVFLQRTQIAALKAVGYADLAVGLHFLKLVSVIVLLGAALGIALGSWLGWELAEIYARFFRFPVLVYRLDARVVITGVGISLGSSLFGALFSVRQIVRLPPAEAMRPPPPAKYRKTLVERVGFAPLLGPAGTMVVREIERRPLRLLLSSLGIAMATAIMVLAWFRADSILALMDAQFNRSWREDVLVTFHEPVPMTAVRALESVPGVRRAEGMRAVPVRFRHGSRFRESTLLGYPEEMDLRRVIDRDFREHPVPPAGVMITEKLAELLDLRRGDRVEAEIREGEYRTVFVRVTDTVDEPFGLQGHLLLPSLWRIMREQDGVNTAVLRVDPLQLPEVQRRLKEMPAVASVLRKETIIRQFEEQSVEVMNATTWIMVLLACTIAVGVVYNNARVALSMRSRDFSSLRVLGYSRGEISGILMGELAVQILLAVPLGLLFGTWLAHGVMATVDPEQYRIPVVITARTYLNASLVTIGAGLVSALLVRRKVDQLDLIAVLKTRE